MGAVGFATPILPGKTEDVRRWGQEIQGARHDEYMAYRQRYGVTKEFVIIQHTPQGDMFVGFFEAADPVQANIAFAASQEPFDVWYKNQFHDVTGLDLNQPLPGFVEVAFGE